MLITVTNSLVKNTHKSYKNRNLTFITNIPHFLWLQWVEGSVYGAVYLDSVTNIQKKKHPKNQPTKKRRLDPKLCKHHYNGCDNLPLELIQHSWWTTCTRFGLVTSLINHRLMTTYSVYFGKKSRQSLFPRWIEGLCQHQIWQLEILFCIVLVVPHPVQEGLIHIKDKRRIKFNI